MFECPDLFVDQPVLRIELERDAERLGGCGLVADGEVGCRQRRPSLDGRSVERDGGGEKFDGGVIRRLEGSLTCGELGVEIVGTILRSGDKRLQAGLGSGGLELLLKAWWNGLNGFGEQVFEFTLLDSAAEGSQLVDEKLIRDDSESQGATQDVGWIDKGGKGDFVFLVPGFGCGHALNIHRDADDREPVVSEAFVQLLPPGQFVSTRSPTGPCADQEAFPEVVRQVDGLTVEIRQDDVGQGCAIGETRMLSI